MFRLSQSSLDFTRYMVENFAALEYKTQEEVLTVIRHTTSVLSVAGVHMIDTIQKSIVQHDASVSHSHIYWVLNCSESLPDSTTTEFRFR